MSHSLSHSAQVQSYEDSRTASFAGTLGAYVVMASLLVVALLATSYPALVAGLLVSFGLVSVLLRSD